MDILSRSTNARRVQLFGGLRVELSQKSLLLPGSKLQALLAYLLLYPTTTHTRESLTDCFWPYADPTRTRRYLSDALYRLQQGLGYDWLVTTPDTLRLIQPNPLWVDVWAFTTLTRSASAADHAAAVALYTDDLLPELYDDWLLPIRVRLREQALQLLTTLADAAQQDGRFDDAFTYYHRITAIDPLNEAAHRGLMRLYTRQGRPAAALAQFNHLEALLRADLDVDPLPETATLADEIAAVYEPQAQRTSDLPLVGRRQERAVLLRAVAAAQQGRGNVILLEGGAGIGKTRLLQAVADGASWRGVTVGWGRGRELGARTPYVPLDGALRELLSGPGSARLRQTLRPETAAALNTMLPNLWPHTPPVPLDFQPNLATAVAVALKTLSAANPFLIILDDVQWASETFWELLPFAAELAETAVLLILAYRPADLRAHPVAWSALQQLDLAVAPQRLTLGGLTLSDSAALAADLGHPIATGDLRSLQRATQGNPLHLLESLIESGAAATLPSLNDLLHIRLERLSPSARAALEMAAVLGRDVAHGIWQAVLGDDLVTALPELLSGRFLHETSHGYTFQHDLIREQVYQAIPRAQLQTLHAGAAATLRQQKANPAILAWHYEQAGRQLPAIHYHRLAGEQAMGAFAYTAALDHFEAALALLGDDTVGSEDTWQLLFARQQVLELLGRVAEWRAAVAHMQALAVQQDHPALTLAALEARLQIDALDSDLPALQTNAAAALALAQQLGDTAAEVRVRNVIGWHQLDALARPHTACQHLVLAAEQAALIRDLRMQLTVLGNLALGQRLMGQSHRSLQTANQMLALTHLHPSLQRGQALALHALANAAMHEVEWQMAWQTLNKAVQHLEELHDLWALGDALFDRVKLGLCLGQLAVARQDIARIIREQQAMGIPSGSHYMLWSAAYAGLVAVTAGDWETAARQLPALKARLASGPEVRVRILGHTVLGLWHLWQGDGAGAVAPLSAAVALWRQGEPSIELTPLFYHAIACHRTGDTDTARESLAQAAAVLHSSQARHFEVLWHYTQSVVEDDDHALLSAQEALQAQAHHIEDPLLRQAFLANVPLHREVMAGRGPAVIQTVQLPAANGAPASVTVRWTTDAGAADAAIRQQQGAIALRHHRLRRLLAEAADQGAAPTNNALAAALNVSRRTIQRDLKTAITGR